MLATRALSPWELGRGEIDYCQIFPELCMARNVDEAFQAFGGEDEALGGEVLRSRLASW